MLVKASIAVALSFPLGTIAWGSVSPIIHAIVVRLANPPPHYRATGHEAIGYIAQAFLGPNTLEFVQNTLYSGYAGQLGAAATWADNVKYEAGWTW